MGIIPSASFLTFISWIVLHWQKKTQPMDMVWLSDYSALQLCQRNEVPIIFNIYPLKLLKIKHIPATIDVCWLSLKNDSSLQQQQPQLQNKGRFLVIELRGRDDTVMLFLGLKSTFWTQQFSCFMCLDKFNILLCTDAITCLWYNPKTALVVRGHCDIITVRIKLIYTYLSSKKLSISFRCMWTAEYCSEEVARLCWTFFFFWRSCLFSLIYNSLHSSWHCTA